MSEHSTAPTEHDDTRLTRSEADLAVIASYVEPDRFLLELIDLADDGGGLAVGLLINGMVVCGRLAKPEAAAEQIDAQVRRVLGNVQHPAEHDEEEWAQAVERISTRASRKVERFRAEAQKLERDIEEGGYDGPLTHHAPAEIADTAIRYEARGHLTLDGVQIAAPGQPGVTHLPVLRVQLSQVTAWWPLTIHEDGSTAFTLWQGDGTSADAPG